MRVRVRVGGIVRLLILCGLIAEVILAPLAQAGPPQAVAAQKPSLARTLVSAGTSSDARPRVRAARAMATTSTTGALSLCVADSPSGSLGGMFFTFTVTEGSFQGTYSVPVGNCTTSIALPVGQATITETAQTGVAVSAISALGGSVVSANLAQGSATVTINPSPNSSGYATQTIATFTDRPSGGVVPWHPHRSMRMSAGLDASVDLADGHIDVDASDLSIPGRGPSLTLNHTWDSVLAQGYIMTTASQGWSTNLTRSIGGVLTATVTYTDATGMTWPFVYSGPLAPTSGLYTAYSAPPGQPWQLTASTGGYTLTNFLNGAVTRFDATGRYLSDTDSYGNSDALGAPNGGVQSWANSGGRALRLASYGSGLLSDVQSPLWQSSGGAQGQHVTYGYSGGQLTSMTRGAGTTDAVTTTFGYSGTLMTGITTPANRTWALGYDGAGRVTSMTSPVSGTAGQPGYTPAYTMRYTYNPRQTVVVAGAGTSAALTTTYTLDAAGEATSVTDGLGNTSRSTYDADHDILTSADANGNTTTNKYQYIGPNGYSGAIGVSGTVGQVVEEDQPAIQPYSPLNGLMATPVITHSYDASTHDLVATLKPEGGLTRYSYDGHHSVAATTEQTTPNTCATQCATTWRGTLTQYDQYGERTGTTDGRGVSVDASGNATLNDPGGQYTSHTSYNAQGDLASESTPPIATTLNGNATTAPVTTTYTYDGDGNRQTLISANGNTTTYRFDHLSRPATTTLPSVTLYNNTTTQPVETTGYDGDGNAVRQTDANGNTTTSSYDPLGRQVSTTNPVSGTSLMTYTASELTARQDAQGNVTGYGYDAAGRQIQTTNPATGTMQTAYDAAGNTTAMTTTDRTAGNAAVTLDQLGYDALNRVITDTVVTNTANIAGSALTTLTRYDQDGNVAQTQQPNGDVVYDVYDAADRLTNVEIDPAPLTKGQAATHPSYEAYGYDGAGNQTFARDADNRATTTQYDGAGRMTQSVAASAAPTGTTTITTTLGYDPDGNTLRQTTQTVDSTSPGQVQTHTTTSSYNAADWETSTTDDGLTTSYSYDVAGQQRGESSSDALTNATTSYDAAGRVTSISENAGGAGPYTTQYAYNQNDLPTQVTLPGGVSEQAGYDANSALTSLLAQGPNTGATTTTLNTAYGYGYNAAGWITGTTTISGTDTIAHDGAGRLTSDCGQQPIVRNTTDHCYRWTYDKNGNVTSQVADTGATTAYSYSPTQPNALLHATQLQANVPAQDRYPNPDTYYGYDGHGDTTAITSPVNGAYTDTAAINDRLQYDAQQRPITITHLEGGIPITISLGYNADGLRARYTVAMSGTAINDERFQYRDGSLAQVSAVTATLNANGSVKSQGLPYTDTYIYGPGGEPLEFLRQQSGQTNRYWYALDGQGSVVAVTDVNGKVVDRYNYDSWGESIGVGAKALARTTKPYRSRCATPAIGGTASWSGPG